MLKVLVVAAHPDDEVLGCGGTLARHAAAGDEVQVIFMTDGVAARGGVDPAAVQRREAAKQHALGLLGVHASSSLGFADNQMDSVPLLTIIQALEAHIQALQPQIIYTHHHADLNLDHRLTFQAVMTACRPLPQASVRKILSFEVMSSTEWAGGMGAFEPGVFVDISAFWARKRAALQAYDEEMRQAPHSRSLAHLDALALHRGHCVGVDRAEAFVLVREII
jgi:LmbE family N-acetylglucosaminyl deacetylase